MAPTVKFVDAPLLIPDVIITSIMFGQIMKILAAKQEIVGNPIN